MGMQRLGGVEAREGAKRQEGQGWGESGRGRECWVSRSLEVKQTKAVGLVAQLCQEVMGKQPVGSMVHEEEEAGERAHLKGAPGTFVMVLWLRFLAPNAGGLGSIPGWGI